MNWPREQAVEAAGEETQWCSKRDSQPRGARPRAAQSGQRRRWNGRGVRGGRSRDPGPGEPPGAARWKTGGLGVAEVLLLGG